MNEIRHSLLIVDDELTTRRLLTYLLEPYYNVFCAENGEKAKKWLEAGNTADLIITDIEMPIMNGFELIEMLTSEPSLSHIPVMVISSLTEESIKDNPITSGVKVILKKPVEPKVLFWRVEQLLSQAVYL